MLAAYFTISSLDPAPQICWDITCYDMIWIDLIWFDMIDTMDVNSIIYSNSILSCETISLTSIVTYPNWTSNPSNQTAASTPWAKKRLNISPLPKIHPLYLMEWTIIQLGKNPNTNWKKNKSQFRSQTSAKKKHLCVLWVINLDSSPNHNEPKGPQFLGSPTSGELPQVCLATKMWRHQNPPWMIGVFLAGNDLAKW